jgi:hypothetical protein
MESGNRLRSSVLLLVVALGCLVIVGAGGSVPGSASADECGYSQLAFSLPGPPAPSQTQAVGLDVHNTGRACRLELPVSLALSHRAGKPMRVSPRLSRLTLVAGMFKPRQRAWVTWTYANYCGRHNSSERPVVHVLRTAGIELREYGGTPPCHDPRRPVGLDVLFACPGARGPAVRAILPRPLKLCPDERHSG